MAKKTTSKSERNYGLSVEEVVELKAEYSKSKKLPNPHRNGCYGWIVSALVNLGVNKWHPMANLMKRIQQEATKEKWAAFAAKKKRNKESGLDCSERIHQNLLVLQRPDYGSKIYDLKKVIGGKGVVIDLRRDGEKVEAGLNTDSSTPMKLGKAKTVKIAKAKAPIVIKGKAKIESRPPILEGRAALAALKK